MSNLKEYTNLKATLDKRQVTLIAVSKTKPTDAILSFYQLGQRAFGENKVQELVQKYELLPKDIKWHLIGHLQRNKVKHLVSFIHLIHTVDSLKLLLEVDKQAKRVNRVIDVLLQFHIAEEEHKFGFSWQEVISLMDNPLYQSMKNIRICGVMGMATFTNDEEQIRREFQQLNSYFKQLKTVYFSASSHFKEISMGMSGDFHIAVQEGSTMVRVGSLLFGKRN